MRRLPDDRSPESGFGATFQLLYCPVDIIDRDRADADQTIRSNFAIINQPVVVCSETGLLQLCIIHGEVRQQVGRVKHLGAKSIGFHFLDSAIWVRPAGMGLKALPYFEHRKNRSLFSERGRNSLLYGIGWFHHVGVRRNQHLAACVVSVASHKVFSSFGGMRCIRVRTSFRPSPYGLLAGLPPQTSTGQVFAKMERWITECWSTGLKRITPLLHNSTIPFSKTVLPFPTCARCARQ